MTLTMPDWGWALTGVVIALCFILSILFGAWSMQRVIEDNGITWDSCPEDHSKLVLYGDPCARCGVVQGSDMK